jgi:UTP--glucose-1-phosphate uridylyltransferase
MKRKRNRKNKIKKAVIAVAGYGTRFLPATKNQAKQMLPIIDKPIVQHVVEEAVNSGIEDIIIVTQAGHTQLEDHFDTHVELEHVLEENGKKELLAKIKHLPEMANFVYVRQNKHMPYGNGTPLLTASSLIDNDETFVYMFGDDLTIAKKPVTKQLIDVYEKYKPSAILAVQEVPPEEIDRYASIEYKKRPKYKYEMKMGHEKLPAGKAPSNMAQFGRFVFTYDVIREARKTPLGKGGELWTIDILNKLAKKGRRVFAQPIEGEWMTTGDPLRYMQTQVRFALERKDIGDDFADFLRSLKL